MNSTFRHSALRNLARRRLNIAALAAATALFAGAGSTSFATPDFGTAEPVAYSATRILEIGYRGLNLAPLFWERPAQFYRIELQPLTTDQSGPIAASAMLKDLDLTNINPPTTFNWGEVRAGAYRMRLWSGTGAASVLVEQGPVVVIDSPQIASVRRPTANAEQIAQR